MHRCPVSPRHLRVALWRFRHHFGKAIHRIKAFEHVALGTPPPPPPVYFLLISRDVQRQLLSPWACCLCVPTARLMHPPPPLWALAYALREVSRAQKVGCLPRHLPATSVPDLGSQQPPRHGSQRLGHRLGKREKEIPQQSQQIRKTCLSKFSHHPH